MNFRYKYESSLTEVQTWDYIENRFSTDWCGIQVNMLKLVRHIIVSGLSKRLYGSTSLDKLIISIYNPIEYDRESIHISFDVLTRKWHFEYFSIPFQKSEFVRTCSEEKGIEKFQSFIEMIGW